MLCLHRRPGAAADLRLHDGAVEEQLQLFGESRRVQRPGSVVRERAAEGAQIPVGGGIQQVGYP